MDAARSGGMAAAAASSKPPLPAPTARAIAAAVAEAPDGAAPLATHVLRRIGIACAAVDAKALVIMAVAPAVGTATPCLARAARSASTARVARLRAASTEMFSSE